MYRILIVEDDRGIAGAVQTQLEAWGLEARCVSDFRNVLGEFAQYQPHLVLMDIGLPFFNGFHWCSQIRTVSQVPIVFLSSASDNMNLVMAMNMGADDFIAKPFDQGVLIAQGKNIDLTKNEYRILLALMQNKGSVVSRERLMELLWEGDSFVDENTLTVNVNRLRKKLDGAGLKAFITTKFGVGYLIS